MRTLSAVLVVVAGFSQLGCGDSGGGAGLGPETSWQLDCITGKPCGAILLDAHGPIGGPDDEISDDDQKLDVTCTSNAAGIKISISDPGREKADPDNAAIRSRARSLLEISNIRADDNQCFVTVTEYPRNGEPAQLRVIETCAGTKGTQEGNCEITGGKADGYDFSGTLSCPGMRVNNNGDANFKLGAARAVNDPIQLQIVSCK